MEGRKIGRYGNRKIEGVKKEWMIEITGRGRYEN